MSQTNDFAISIRNVSKTFKLPHQNIKSIKGLFLNVFRGRRTYEKQIVLKNISFDIKKGEFFGIVGRNGGGKSTLLKLISGIYAPDDGQILVNGKLIPFIELGVGFNPELTGRENVYLNGALLGYGTKEMDKMYDEIVSFAELERFMDQKLNNYSSGMQVRLAFSIAIKADTDILVLDEVLAVGDSNFQQKCIQQFYSFKKQGKTIVLVSHSMDMVEKFCDRVAVINKGELDFVGNPTDAVVKYEELNIQEQGKATIGEVSHKKYDTSINSIEIISKGRSSKSITENQDFILSVDINSAIDRKDLFIAFKICEAESRLPVIAIDSEEDKQKIDIKKGKNTLKIKISNNSLTGGKYYVIMAIYNNKERAETYGLYNGMQAGSYFLIKGKSTAGIINVSREWNC